MSKQRSSDFELAPPILAIGLTTLRLAVRHSVHRDGDQDGGGAEPRLVSGHIDYMEAGRMLLAELQAGRVVLQRLPRQALGLVSWRRGPRVR